MALPGKTQWRRQAILTRIHQALDAFMILQKVDWDYDVRHTLDEILALAAKDAEDGLRDLARLRRVEAPSQLRGEFDLEPGCGVGHRLVESSRQQAVETFSVPR